MSRIVDTQIAKILGAILVLALVSLGCAAISDLVDGPGDTYSCPTELEEETLNRLRLSLEPTLGMVPGGSTTLEVGVQECCVYFEPVDTCVEWSVAPETGASINNQGQLSIDSGVADGAVYQVTADVEDGRRLVTIDVHVFDPDASPLVGKWKEAAQIRCDGEGESPVTDPINELVFFADGRINVTWYPFEVYVDYWGDYTFAPDTATSGQLGFTVQSGNYVPADLDTEGTYTIDQNGDLVLEGIWLGNWMEASGPARCGHRFSK